jgi:NAD(P)-dependent dehydrogenase (short-subunit alcohol dehydrogenase family)
MKKRLEGKIALVNGAGSSGPGWGNGKCTAVQFAREGARLVLVDINRTAAEETAHLVAQEGGQSLVVEADVVCENDMKRVVETCLKQFGRLDILVQIVGIAGTGTFLTETEEGWDHVFAVNLKGTLFAARAAIVPMLRQKWGRIITVSSIVGMRFTGRGIPYSYGVSKAAVAHMTRLIALEYADQGIRANCIAIGMMDTPMVRRGFGPESADKICAIRDAGSPTGKQGTGWDTAHLAAFLASDEANYVNGVELPIDGGFTAAAPQIYPKELTG